MRFSLLGPLEVRDGEQAVSITAGKQRALLADLLLNANRAVPTARLIDDLWGEQVPDTAVKALQVHVSKLRKALPPGRLLTRGPGYLLEVGDGELDLHAFARGLDEGRAALARGESERASALLEDALTLWRGPALAEFDEPFAHIEAARLEELHLSGVEERIEADLGVGRHAALVAELEGLVAAHPLRERLRAQLMLALYRSGRQAEALEAYQSYRVMLDDDLGIEPSPSLRDLERRVLQHDPTLDLAMHATRITMARSAPSLANEPPRGEAPAPAAPLPIAAASSRAQLVVGRDDELRSLHRLMSEAAAGERRLVFVSGEPGAGKTTLVNAFLAGLDPAVRVGVGQCIESRGSGEAYHPVLEALARVARGDGGATLVRLLRERAPTWLLQLPWLVPEEERAETEARVLGTTRDRMLREIVEVLDAFTSEQPLVVVLEDLQWADYSTVDLVDVIARRFEPARLLILGTHRSEPAAADANPLLDLVRTLRLRNLCMELALRPLDDADIAAYVAARLDGAELGPELPTLIRARTRGNPLFVEKLVEAWLDEGWIVAGDAGWQLARGLDELGSSVPATLRMLMEQRCKAAGPDVLALLEAAALVGAEFAVALAAHAAGTEEDVAERLLLDASRSGALIEAAGEAVWPDGTVSSVYAFVHDLCYEVLQGRLPIGRRVRLHRRIADRLEEAHRDQGEEIAAELAWHFLQAREPARAVRYLQGAAERALELNAPREALEHLGAARAALGAIPDARARTDAELRVQQLIGRAALVTDGYASPDAEQALVRARQLASAHGDVEQLAVASHGLATLYEIRGEYARSEEILAETLTLPGIATVPGPLVDSNELMACSLYHQGAFDRSLEHAEAALDAYDGVYANPLAAAFGEHPGVSCHLWAALSTWFLGLPDRALDRAERAVAATTIGPRFRARAMAQAQASVIAYLRGDVATARDWAAAALATAAELGVGYWMSMAGVVHGWTGAVDGDATGLDEIREATERSRAVGARMDEPFYLAVLADAAMRCGRLDEARGAVDEGIELAGGRAFFFEPELLRLRGVLAGATGVTDLRAAVAAARRLGSPSLELRALTTLVERTEDPVDVAALGELLARFEEGATTADHAAARDALRRLGIEPERRPSSTDGVPEAEPPEAAPVRYAISDGLSIAYQVTGGGPVDLLLVPGFVSHLEKDWDDPRHAAFLDRLGSFARLIRFDKRGTGLSDRVQPMPDLEARMDDLRAVLDAVGSGEAVVLGYSEGGPLAMLFAATHPERVRALVLFGAYAKRSTPDDDYPWAATLEERTAYIDALVADWGLENDMHVMCPSADEAMARWWGERCRAAASPGAIRALMETNSSIDVRDILGSISVPTLVLHRGTDYDVKVEEGRYIAERIPGARFVELPGADHFPAVDPDQILDEVEPFVRALGSDAGEHHPGERVLATVMVTDIVDSTAALARLGDRGWADLLEREQAAVRDELQRHAGEEIDAVGDGFLALFDGPARAIRCGRAIANRVAELGVDVRVGVHTGEVERRDGVVRGIAVHLAARVAAQAGPGEVLVSATTSDLVAGSGLRFVDRGEHELQGIEGPRRLFALLG